MKSILVIGMGRLGRSFAIKMLQLGNDVMIVDMDEQIAESGSYNVPVKFMITSNSTTFVSGTYTVLIDVEPA